jgi:ribosomal protein S5
LERRCSRRKDNFRVSRGKHVWTRTFGETRATLSFAGATYVALKILD